MTTSLDELKRLEATTPNEALRAQYRSEINRREGNGSVTTAELDEAVRLLADKIDRVDRRTPALSEAVASTVRRLINQPVSQSVTALDDRKLSRWTAWVQFVSLIIVLGAFALPWLYPGDASVGWRIVAGLAFATWLVVYEWTLRHP